LTQSCFLGVQLRLGEKTKRSTQSLGIFNILQSQAGIDENESSIGFDEQAVRDDGNATKGRSPSTDQASADEVLCRTVEMVDFHPGNDRGRSGSSTVRVPFVATRAMLVSRLRQKLTFSATALLGFGVSSFNINLTLTDEVFELLKFSPQSTSWATFYKLINWQNFKKRGIIKSLTERPCSISRSKYRSIECPCVSV